MPLSEKQREMRAERMPAWKAESLLDRCITAATLLLIHGFISDGERERIHARMLKVFGRP